MKDSSQSLLSLRPDLSSCNETAQPSGQQCLSQNKGNIYYLVWHLHRNAIAAIAIANKTRVNIEFIPASQPTVTSDEQPDVLQDELFTTENPKTFAVNLILIKYCCSYVS